jgi:hypothetical protein
MVCLRKPVTTSRKGNLQVRGQRSEVLNELTLAIFSWKEMTRASAFVTFDL